MRRRWKARGVAGATVVLAVAALAVVSPAGQAQALTSQEIVNANLPLYNEKWTSASTSVTGSMPVGNGVQAANVWVEGSTLKLLLSAGDAWDENDREAKLGRLDITFSPNPFASGSFLQELKLKEGEVVITSGTSPVITTRVWADANQKALHVESNAGSAFTVTANFVNVRPSLVTNPPTGSFNFVELIDTEGSGAVPNPPFIRPDTVYSRTNEILWNHHNTDSRYDEINARQLLSTTAYPDPLTGRTFGGLIRGAGFTTTSATQLVSASATSQRLDINLSSTVDTSASWLSTWENQITAAASTVAGTNIETLRSAHQGYWSSFWAKAYIFATGDADAATVTKGWLNARYLNAIAGRTPGVPIRFNGSLFTPGTAADADFRLWNDFHGFNQRFPYWAMLAAGDFDLMQPYFQQYRNSLDLAKERVAKFWGAPAQELYSTTTLATQGAMWPEVMGLWGAATGGEYGWNRGTNPPNWWIGSWTRYLYEQNVELTSMMLDYYEYTGDNTFLQDTLLPVAREVVKFYGTHWADVNGKINMYPMYSGEGDRGVTNPMADVAGLTKTVNGLLALPTTQTTAADRNYWASVQARLPNLPIGSTVSDNDLVYGSADRLKTAYNLFRGSDTNNQNLWPIWPLRMFGNGQPNLATAVASYNDRTGKYPSSGGQDWRWDAPLAASLGLTDEAKFQTVAAFRPGSWRFSGYSIDGGDGSPGIESHAIASNALQLMLLKPTTGSEALLFNAWPATWDVKFKLHTTAGRTVEGSKTGTATAYTVTPTGVGTIVVNPFGPAPIAPLNRTGWTATADSQETAGENGAVANVLDGNTSTIWHTQYVPTIAPLPHQVTIDMKTAQSISALEYLPRQSGGTNGNISTYQVQTSTNGTTFTTVASGTFTSATTAQKVSFAATTARYVRLVATGSINGAQFTSAAEINVYAG